MSYHEDFDSYWDNDGEWAEADSNEPGPFDDQKPVVDKTTGYGVRYIEKGANLDVWMNLLEALNRRRISEERHFYLSSKRWDELLAEIEPMAMNIHSFQLSRVHNHPWGKSCVESFRIYFRDSENTAQINA